MGSELTGRSCIRSTMEELVTTNSKPSALAEEVAHSEMLWYAGYTASRHEKRVAEHFVQRGVEHFLPLYETIHRWNNGRHRVKLPLFPGYIFVRMALKDRLRVLEVPGFVRLVGFNSLPYPLPESDINKMMEALSKGVLAEPYPYLTAGTRVEIENGPLQGMTGILLRRQNKCRLVISIDLIMRSMIVEVEAGDVVPIRKSAFSVGENAAGGKTTDQQAQV